jgi:hypothetical protein
LEGTIEVRIVAPRHLSPRLLTSTPTLSKVGPMACMEAITRLRTRYILTRNTSTHPRVVVRGATIGTVGGTIRGLGVVLFTRPPTILDPIIAITRPMLDPARIGPGWNHSCRWFVGSPLPRNLSLTPPIASMWVRRGEGHSHLGFSCYLF